MSYKQPPYWNATLLRHWRVACLHAGDITDQPELQTIAYHLAAEIDLAIERLRDLPISHLSLDP